MGKDENNVAVAFNATVYKGDFLPPRVVCAAAGKVGDFIEYYRCPQVCVLYLNDGNKALGYFTYADLHETDNERTLTYWQEPEDQITRFSGVIETEQVLLWFYVPDITLEGE